MLKMANCAFRYNGHKCPHPRYQDSKYCVFHHESPDEKCADFQASLEALIKEREEEGADSIDMRGFIFPDIELSNKTFSATGTLPAKLEFQTSHFHGGVVFRNSIHMDEVNFSECVFHQPIEFQNCTFQHDVAFRKCEIMATCDFSSTKFHNEASFSNTTFQGVANFRFAEFREKAS
uniref:Pentapeptide repeat-containing protein n=1 Tax=Candidatus Kentrum sp. TUN TaxID=2126343 RepID=A0A451AUX8_9GAMM|nr:MAG: Pentapeptide repeat-containing protein [Candidatus Kentron sp. TUN]VFK69860.1 MAG: Pentapeptide repeat-containing protein [Candidatus Kentron sp. TUN]